MDQESQKNRLENGISVIPNSEQVMTIPRSLLPNRLLVCKIVNKGVNGWRHPYANRLLSVHSSCTLYFEFAENGSAHLTSPFGKKIWKNFQLFLDPGVEKSIINFHFDGWDLGKNFQLIKFFSYHRKRIRHLTVNINEWLMIYCGKYFCIENLLKIFAPKTSYLKIKSLPSFWQDNITLLLSSFCSAVDEPDSNSLYPLPPAAHLTNLKIVECPEKFFGNASNIIKDIVRAGIQLREFNLKCDKTSIDDFSKMKSWTPFIEWTSENVVSVNILKTRLVKDLNMDLEMGLTGFKFISICEPKLENFQLTLSWMYGEYGSKCQDWVLKSILYSSKDSLVSAKFEMTRLQFPNLLKGISKFPKLKRLEWGFPLEESKKNGNDFKAKKKSLITFSTEKFPQLELLTLGTCPQIEGQTDLTLFDGIHDQLKSISLNCNWLCSSYWLDMISQIFVNVQQLHINECNISQADFSNLGHFVQNFSCLKKLEIKLTVGPAISYDAFKAVTFIAELTSPTFNLYKSEMDNVKLKTEQEEGVRVQFCPMEKVENVEVDENDLRELSSWLYSPVSMPFSFLMKPQLPVKIPVIIFAGGRDAVEQTVTLLGNFSKNVSKKRKAKASLVKGEKN